MSGSEHPRVSAEPGYSGSLSDGRDDSTSMESSAAHSDQREVAEFTVEPPKRHDTPIPRPKMQVVEKPSEGFKIPEIPISETLLLFAGIMVVVMFCAMAVGMVVSYRASHRVDPDEIVQPETPESHEGLPVRRSLN